MPGQKAGLALYNRRSSNARSGTSSACPCYDEPCGKNLDLRGMPCLMPSSKPYDLKGKRVWVAGHRGMAGSAIVRRLAAEQCEVLTAARQQVDLRRQAEVEAWLDTKRPHAVFIAAAT